MILLAVVQIALRNLFDAGLLWADPLLRLTVLFVAIVCLPIAALAGRSYLARGDPGLLWLSGGAIVWAFAGLVANALAPWDINAAVTAHNLLAWTSAACHLVGAFVLPRPQARASGSDQGKLVQDRQRRKIHHVAILAEHCDAGCCGSHLRLAKEEAARDTADLSGRTLRDEEETGQCWTGWW